jgi:hypothetical protein
MRSRTGRAFVALVLAAGFILVAFAGISLAFLGDARNGHSAQAPLGTLSANDGNRSSGDEALRQENAGQPGGEEGIAIAPVAEGPASLPSTESGSGGGGDAASLPFTGLLAIPILLVGVAMLGTGLLLRRRRPARPAA